MYRQLKSHSIIPENFCFQEVPLPPRLMGPTRRQQNADENNGVGWLQNEQVCGLNVARIGMSVRLSVCNVSEPSPFVPLFSFPCVRCSLVPPKKPDFGAGHVRHHGAAQPTLMFPSASYRRLSARSMTFYT